MLEIAGVGTLRIAPGRSESFAADEAALAAHRKSLASHLAQARAASVPEAEQRLAERRALEGKLAEASAELRAHAPEGIEALERAHAGLAAMAARQPAPAAASADSLEAKGEEVAGQLGAAEHELAAAEAAHAVAREELAGRHALAADRREAIAEAAASLGDAKARATKLRSLNESAAAAQAALNAAVREHDAWRETAPEEAQFAELKRLADGAAAACTRADRELNDLRHAEAGLEGELKADRADDVAARVSELDQSVETAQARVRDLEAEVGALQLLDRELEAAAGAARERFAQPVMARLGPYLQIVFPEASLSLGEGFAVDKIARQAVSEDRERLSHGTQEQLAILVRLGFARLLAETGSPAPLILDDALVYADDERIDRMFEALRLAAQTHQVLVLTCRERTFATLGGNRIAMGPWRPQ